MNTEFLVF